MEAQLHIVELRFHVYSFMSFMSLGRLAQTCKAACQELAESLFVPRAWRKLLARELPSPRYHFGTMFRVMMRQLGDLAFFRELGGSHAELRLRLVLKDRRVAFPSLVLATTAPLSPTFTWEFAHHGNQLVKGPETLKPATMRGFKDVAMAAHRAKLDRAKKRRHKPQALRTAIAEHRSFIAQHRNRYEELVAWVREARPSVRSLDASDVAVWRKLADLAAQLLEHKSQLETIEEHMEADDEEQ